MRRRGAAILAATLALGAPASALAQSAGDEQYRDPFADDGGSGQSGGSGGGQTPPSGGGGSGSSGTAPPPVTAPTEVAGETTAVTPTTAAPGLPRTGSAAWALAGIGIALLAAGVGLRRRTVRA